MSINTNPAIGRVPTGGKPPGGVGATGGSQSQNVEEGFQTGMVGAQGKASVKDQSDISSTPAWQKATGQKSGTTLYQQDGGPGDNYQYKLTDHVADGQPDGMVKTKNNDGSYQYTIPNLPNRNLHLPEKDYSVWMSADKQRVQAFMGENGEELPVQVTRDGKGNISNIQFTTPEKYRVNFHPNELGARFSKPGSHTLSTTNPPPVGTSAAPEAAPKAQNAAEPPPQPGAGENAGAPRQPGGANNAGRVGAPPPEGPPESGPMAGGAAARAAAGAAGFTAASQWSDFIRMGKAIGQLPPNIPDNPSPGELRALQSYGILPPVMPGSPEARAMQQQQMQQARGHGIGGFIQKHPLLTGGLAALAAVSLPMMLFGGMGGGLGGMLPLMMMGGMGGMGGMGMMLPLMMMGGMGGMGGLGNLGGFLGGSLMGTMQAMPYLGMAGGILNQGNAWTGALMPFM